MTGLRVLPGGDPMGEWELQRTWAVGSVMQGHFEAIQHSGLGDHVEVMFAMRARGILCSVGKRGGFKGGG